MGKEKVTPGIPAAKSSQAKQHTLNSSAQIRSSNFYASGTVFKNTWIVVDKRHQLAVMNKYEVNEWGIPNKFSQYTSVDSYHKAIGNGTWTVLKSHGWEHRYCTDSQTKLQVSIHINPIYKEYIKGKKANFTQGELCMRSCYFTCREEIEQYILYHLGLENYAKETHRYQSSPPKTNV
jgi:hypothetical protein